MSDLNRRELVAVGVVGVCACCCGELAIGASDPPASGPATSRIDAGPLSQFSVDGVFDALRQSHKVIIYRQGRRLYASTARCTHKNCVLRSISPTQLKCPCHGSEFDINGTPTDGPASVSLSRYGVAIEDGRLMVDTKQQFPEAKWDEAGAFVEVPG